MSEKLEAPVAERTQQVEVRHGQRVTDPYAWMRERGDPRVKAYLEAENAYTESVMKPTEGLQEELYREMLGRIKETDVSVPVRVGEHFYYTRTEEAKQYPFHCRKKGGVEAAEELLLDENALAEGHDYLRLGAIEVSPDHNLLAFSSDVDGGEKYTLRFKDLRTGDLLPDTIPETYVSLEWAEDNRTVFYTTVDSAHRPYRLYRHVLGTDRTEDHLVYQEDDESYFLGLYKTKSRKYLMLYLESITTTEIRFLDAANPTGRFETIHPRRQGMEYSAEHWGDRLYIVTNDDAVNFKLVSAPVTDPARRNWEEIIPHRLDVKIEGVVVFARHMALLERENGLTGLRVSPLPGWDWHRIEQPEPVYTLAPSGNREFDSDVLRFTYDSLVTPPSVFDYDLRTRERELKKQDEVLGGYDAKTYRSERRFARAPDGERVPISLVYREGLVKDGRNPLLLYAYGAYGATVDPGFASTRLSLLDRGWVYAIAHVRGGGALGRPWYDDGKLLNKKNTFADFIACAEYLVAERYTAADRMAICGASAGGLLMGAATNMRPDLFAAVVAKVPFVDVVNTMLDRSLPLTVIEWEEWGNPQDECFHDYMRSYSPYDNVSETAYPHLLITSGLNDPRVAFWEPAKWTARLRALKTDDNVLLLKTNMDAGHSGPSGRYNSLRDLAFEYAFLLDRVR